MKAHHTPGLPTLWDMEFPGEDVACAHANAMEFQKWREESVEDRHSGWWPTAYCHDRLLAMLVAARRGKTLDSDDSDKLT